MTWAQAAQYVVLPALLFVLMLSWPHVCVLAGQVSYGRDTAAWSREQGCLVLLALGLCEVLVAALVVLVVTA